MDNVVIQKVVPGKSAAQIISRVKEIRAQAKRNEAELVKLNIELGWLFTELKAQAPGTWGKKLENEGYSQRVVSRLMKAAKVLAPSGTVAPKMAEKLPSDPIKLEALAGLGLDVVDSLIRDKVDLRQKDRGEIVELVKERKGETSGEEKTTPSVLEAVRQTWSAAVEALFKKFNKLEGTEREQFIDFLDASLEDLKESLHKVEDEVDEEDQAGEADDDDDSGEEVGESTSEDEPASKAEEREVPAAKAPATKDDKTTVGRRQKQNA